MQNHAPIVLTTYDFYKELHQSVKLFPRDEQLTLGSKIKSLTIESLEIFCRAEYQSRNLQTGHLEAASAKLDLTKLLIRLCYDLKLINNKKYFALEQQLQEIGKMLGGWLKFCRKA